MISDRQYRTFNIQLNSLPGGRRHEPGEPDPEQPRLMRHILENYQREMGYSADQIRDVMVITRERFDEFYLGAPQRRLRAVEASARTRPMLRKAAHAASGNGQRLLQPIRARLRHRTFSDGEAVARSTVRQDRMLSNSTS